MKIERTDLQDGACNFCKCGKISECGTKLIYPYKEVTVVSGQGSGLAVRFCDQCLSVLKQVI